MSLVVRPWTPTDRASLIALNAELQEHERALRPSRLPGADMAEGFFDDLVENLSDEDEDGELYVAEQDGVVVGFLSCFLEEDPLENESEEVMIHDFVVTRSAQRSGVGRALVEAARGFAKERGAGRIAVSALMVNSEAIDAYRALGFRPVTMIFEADV